MKSSFFDAVDYDRLYSSADWAKYFRQFIGNGVYGTSMQVYSCGGMKLNISAGSCFINGYCGYCENESVTLNVGDSSNVRYDAVCARLDMKKRDIHIQIIEGDYIKKPEPVRNEMYYDLVLCYVLVDAGATEISDADITDTRFDNDLCGCVSGVVNQISTTELFRQFNAEWTKFVDSLASDDRISIMTIDETARKTANSAQNGVPLSGLLRLN